MNKVKSELNKVRYYGLINYRKYSYINLKLLTRNSKTIHIQSRYFEQKRFYGHMLEEVMIHNLHINFKLLKSVTDSIDPDNYERNSMLMATYVRCNNNVNKDILDLYILKYINNPGILMDHIIKNKNILKNIFEISSQNIIPRIKDRNLLKNYISCIENELHYANSHWEYYTKMNDFEHIIMSAEEKIRKLQYVLQLFNKIYLENFFEDHIDQNTI